MLADISSLNQPHPVTENAKDYVLMLLLFFLSAFSVINWEGVKKVDFLGKMFRRWEGDPPPLLLNPGTRDKLQMEYKSIMRTDE